MTVPVLQIPLRAKLTTPHQNSRLNWRRIMALMQMPRGAYLLDTPVTKLPKFLRK